MTVMVITQRQIADIQSVLESVTNQPFRRRIVQNDEKTLLLSWENDSHVGYLLHVMALDYHTYQVAFAQQRYKDIRTRYDQRLDCLQLDRLFNDPRQCVRYLVGQIG